MAKSGSIAALLNFLLWGLGYLYLGKKTTFGIMLVLGELVVLGASSLVNSGAALIIALSYLVVDLAFAYDAFQLAKEPPVA